MRRDPRWDVTQGLRTQAVAFWILGTPKAPAYRPAAVVTSRYPERGWTVSITMPDGSCIGERVEHGELAEVRERTASELDAIAGGLAGVAGPAEPVADDGDLEAFKADRERRDADRPVCPSPFDPLPPVEPTPIARVSAYLSTLILIRGPLVDQVERETWAHADRVGLDASGREIIAADLARYRAAV